jgi:Ca2+-binding EF-hand superfamily protein
MFLVIDTKKDDVIDFEEFLCAVAVFRLGTTEDKIKCKKALGFEI